MNAKKVLLSVVSIALILSVVSMIGFAANANPYDVNGDGRVSVLDAKLVLKDVAGLIDLNDGSATPTDATVEDATVADATVEDATIEDATVEDAALIGDVNGDGAVTALDARLILKSVAGLLTPSDATQADA